MLVVRPGGAGVSQPATECRSPPLLSLGFLWQLMHVPPYLQSLMAPHSAVLSVAEPISSAVPVDRVVVTGQQAEVLKLVQMLPLVLQ